MIWRYHSSHFQASSSVALSTSTLFNSPHHLLPELFHLPRLKLCPHKPSIPLLLLPLQLPQAAGARHSALCLCEFDYPRDLI